MKLRWKSFEKKIRGRVRETVFQSEPLLTEYRLVRKARRPFRGLRRSTMLIIWRCCFLFLFSIFVLLPTQTPSVELILAITVAWTLGMMFYRAAQLWGAFYYSSDLVVFDLLPISNQDVFTRQWRRFLCLSLWSLLDGAIFYWALLMNDGGGIWNAIAGGLGLGALQWLFIPAVAVCLFAFCPRKYLLATGLCFLGTAVVLFFCGMAHVLRLHWFVNAAWLVPPIGWIIQALGTSQSKGPVLDFIPAMIAASVLVFARSAYQRVRREFEVGEPHVFSDGRSQALQDFGERLKKEPEEAATAIQQRQFLDGFDWKNAAFVERLVGRILNTREQVIAEFMVAAQPTWTAQWRRFPIAVTVMAGTVWFFMKMGAKTGVMPFLAIYFLGVLFVGRWRGFAAITGAGLQSPMYAVYPIGFWEMMRVILKINLLKFALGAPVVFAVLLILDRTPQFAHGHLIGYGLKLIAFGLMVQPMIAFMPISPGTNDTRKTGRALAAALFIFIAVVSAFTFFLVWNSKVMLITAVILSVFSFSSLIIYGRWFNRSQIDLVPLAKMQTALPH